MRPETAPVPMHFDASCVQLGVKLVSWKDAVGYVGDMLSERGFATPAYSDHMIQVIEQFGPYIVIAPGIALVHARPGRDTLQNGMAAIVIPEGVDFGHSRFDPVHLVLGVALTRAEDHLTVVASIANAVDQGGVLERALATTDPQEFVDRFVARHPMLDVASARK